MHVDPFVLCILIFLVNYLVICYLIITLLYLNETLLYFLFKLDLNSVLMFLLNYCILYSLYKV